MNAEKGISRRQKAFIVIFILFGSFFISVPGINAQPPNAKQKVSKALSEKVSSLQSEEKVKVIIKLKKPAGQFQTQATRSSVKANILDGGGKVGREYSIFDGLAAEISASKVEALADDPNVELIEYDHPVKVFINDSIPLINADDVWSKVKSGQNVTGVGQTVCVIDTGVNYTNSFFGGGLGSAYTVIGGYDFVNDDNDPMDDHKHGTHVAGIVASTHSTYRGVAPGAKIIAIKSLDNTGSGSSSDVIAGIDWCVNNASLYNISVISMSLGDANYNNNTYCDSSFPSWTTAINSALANNISVVVATGNENNYSGVSSPACIQNATRVTATSKTDSFGSFANRGGLFNDILAAPGVDIWSAYYANDNLILKQSGTSMAAPHVSGLIALLNQEYKAIYSSNPPPDYLFDIINSTGVSLYDSNSVKNYTRIDALAAYNAIDIAPPNITFVDPTPSNNSNLSQNYVFVNATANENLSMARLEWSDANVTMNQSWNANKTGLPDGTYTYKVWGNDSSGAWGVSETRVVTIDTIPPVVALTSPQNMTYTTTSVDLNVSANETIDTWMYSLNDAANVTFTPNTTITAPDGVNNITVWANDSAGNLNSSSVNFSVDVTSPSITIISPQNDTSSDNTPLLNASFGEAVNYTWYNVNSTTNSTLENNTSNLTVQLGTFPDGQHNITVYANDSWGNLNSSIVYFTVDTAPPAITIVSPENTTLSDNTPLLNVTFDEVVNYTWYNVNSTTNSTPVGSTGNLTIELSSLEDGQHNISIYANDSTANLNSSIVWFTVDTVYPNVTNLTATPSSITKGGLTNFTVNVSDDNIDTVLLNVTYPNSTVITETMNSSGGYHLYDFNASEYGSYLARVIANDSAGNTNSTVILSFYAVNSYTNTTNVTNGSTVATINKSDLVIEVTANETKNATVSLEAKLSPSSSSFALVGEINSSSTDADQVIKYLNVTNTTDLTNLSRIKIKMYYTGSEVSGLDNNTLSIYYWNGSSWFKCSEYESSTIPNGPYVYDTGRDTDNQYVWAEVNHFSIYGLAGDIYVASTPTTTTTSSDGGGGGGGGGGGSPSPLSVLSSGANELTSETYYDVLITLSAGGKINRDRFVDAPDTLAPSLLLTKQYPLPSDPLASSFVRTVETKTGDVYTHAAEASEYINFKFGVHEKKLVVARGDLGVDSMAAVAYAKAKNVPILLVKPDEVPSVTDEAITRFLSLGSRDIIIVGGPVAISEAVESELSLKASVKRIYGETRIETALALAEEAYPDKNSVRAIVITDYEYPRIDSVLLSYVLDAPLLYVRSDGLSPLVEKYILDHKETMFGPTKIVLKGVNSKVAAEIDDLFG